MCTKQRHQLQYTVKYIYACYMTMFIGKEKIWGNFYDDENMKPFYDFEQSYKLELFA